jgi:PAS domain S-box-containing protein
MTLLSPTNKAAQPSAEERYRVLFEHSPVAMWVFDCETFEFLAVNDAAVKLYGYTREEFLRMTVKDIRPPGLVPAFVEQMTAVGKDPMVAGAWRHRKKDGRVFSVDGFSHLVDFLGRPARVAFLVDASDQERAIAALRASEARFRALSENAPLGVFEGRDADCTYCNPTLLSILARPPERTLGSGWIEAVHPDDRSLLLSSWTQTVPEGKIWDQEYRIVRPDGSIRWVHGLAAPQKDDANAVSGFVGIIEDITEKRTAEIAMLESEERYRKLLMLSPDAHFVHVDGQITVVNPAFCELLGATDATQLVGKSVLEIVHPDSRETIRKRMKQAASGRANPPLEQKYLRLDGGAVDVEAASTAVQFQGRLEIQVVVRDISSRKAAELALRESEERFKLVARAVSDVIWDWNLSTNKLWWSEGFKTLFGFTEDEIEPGIESWTSRLHPEDHDRVLKSIHNAIDTGLESWSDEYRFKRKDGTFAFVQDRGYIIRDRTGKGVRMVGGVSDLTEKKKLEAQYLRAQRMESIGTLAGGIAHDLNNVLAPILMSVELLKLDAANNPQQLKILDTVHTSARRGADLVRQVLTFARGLDGQRVAINLRHLLGDLERIVAETFPRNVRITAEVPNNLWPIVGDPTQLHQVLLNLAVNARDAMPAGGTLTFAAANITLDAQYAGTSEGARAGPHVVVKVTDTGTGIPVEIRDRIFEPFFTTKVVGKGTGLGLATVHAIVKSHGGFVNVYSEVGRGTTFKIYLPADEALRATPSEMAPVELPRGQGELVLVVDDEFSIRSITQQTLEAFGYRVITARDGAEAVAVFAHQTKDIAVVVIDMMMPVMDGPATIQVLLRLNPDVRVIAASGLNANENVARATGVGVTDFLPKPYTAETMLKLLHDVIRRPAGGKPASAS